MDISQVTPMLLTFNEEQNLGRTLKSLTWAKQILLVDSYSTDSTLTIAASHLKVRVIQRKFDHFADQCNFGLQHIETSWVLSLDADYVCPEGLSEELQQLNDSSAGYQAEFRYAILGRNLRASLYPPRVVLYQRDKAQYIRDGHAHRVQVRGPVGKLYSKIVHDDRKPLNEWLAAQLRYARSEAEKLTAIPPSQLGWKDRLRLRVVVAPWLMFLYCLLVRGLLFNGKTGFYYTMQRVYAELLLSLMLLDKKLRQTSDH